MSKEQDKERRHSPRISEVMDVQFRVAGDLSGSWAPVEALNLSVGGLRFRCPEPLEAGTPVMFHFTLPGLSQELEIRGAVVWTKMQASGVIECGVEFTDLADKDQMMLDRFVEFLKKGV